MSSNTHQTTTKPAPLTAQVSVPQSKSDPSAVKVEEIPLPPVEMWAELDNAAPPPVASASRAVEEPSRNEEQPAPFEELEFIGDAHKKIVPLAHPFRRAGVDVRSIEVRRLRIGEIDAILRDIGDRSVSLFDIYSRMCGQPVAVLRGLVDEDGDAVTAAAFDFLPRALRPAGD